MAYAEKRGKGKHPWRARYKRPDGTLGSEPGFAKKSAAEKWGEEQEAAIRAGRWVDPELGRKTFGDWAREWMKAKSPRGRTVDTRWRRLEKVILPKWEHVPLVSITWFDVEAWANRLDVDETTVTHSVSLMSSIMTGAVDAQHILANPLYGRRRTGISASVSARRKVRKADEEQWAPPEVVLRLADRLGPARGLHVLVTAFAGVRWGEGCGLTRQHVLLTRKQAYGGGVFACPTLRIEQELVEVEERDEDGSKLGTVLRIEEPKNARSVRDIDLPPFLADLLRYHLADWPYEYVFATANGKWWRRSNWGKALRPAADGRPERERRQGVSAREKWEPLQVGLTMRDLRHTHDTYQAQIGVKPVLAFEQAGHKYPGIKGTYQHPTPTMRQERLDGLQEIYERAMAALGWRTLWGRVDLKKHPRS
ncbi:tyrosine-type recombinase/integrase [Streptomyces youssoufiensis]